MHCIAVRLRVLFFSDRAVLAWGNAGVLQCIMEVKSVNRLGGVSASRTRSTQAG